VMIYGEKSNGQNPTKFDYSASKGKLNIDLVVPNLKSSASYVLCLNGKSGLDGNEAICQSGGKKYGPECYLDFKTVFSNKQGNLSYTGTVSLVSSKYDVTFLIKDVEDNYKAVVIIDHCKFEIPQ
ncbi:MAG: hypothetical protein QG657_3869, partial [Acidobacteriota bacterium]|nr:hypothetical protein [Acidobacteriota bacterium]